MSLADIHIGHELKCDRQQWRTEGGFGVFKTPPRNSEGPPKNRAKLSPIVKTVKKNC